MHFLNFQELISQVRTLSSMGTYVQVEKVFNNKNISILASSVASMTVNTSDS